MHRGYIKIWRKTFDSGIQRDPKLFLLWVYLLTEATHKEIDLLIGNQKVHLVPGQLVTGRKTLAKNLFLSQQEIRTRLLRLEKFGNLTIKSTNKFSIISIINWDTYQVKESVTNQQSNQHLTSNQPALNHKQEHKNVKNIRKKEPSVQRKIFERDSIPYILSQTLFQQIIINNPGFKDNQNGRKEPTLQRWSDHTDKMIRIDKRTPCQVFNVIMWASDDSFWRDIILSTSNLRKKFDQLWMKMNRMPKYQEKIIGSAMAAEQFLNRAKLNE